MLADGGGWRGEGLVGSEKKHEEISPVEKDIKPTLQMTTSSPQDPPRVAGGHFKAKGPATFWDKN